MEQESKEIFTAPEHRSHDIIFTDQQPESADTHGDDTVSFVEVIYYVTASKIEILPDATNRKSMFLFTA